MRPLAALLMAVLLVLPAAATLDGLRAPATEAAALQATIVRDAYGVAHVFADDAYALWYANGFVQAQDRLFQMDVLRHVGRGNAASVLGPSLLGSDLAARRDLYSEQQRVERFLASPPEARFVLDAFTDGVNRAMAEMVASGTLPAEFPVLNHPPEPWTSIDSVAVIDYLIDNFGVGGGDELGNARLLARLEAALPAPQVEAAFRDHVWTLSNEAYPTIPLTNGTFPGPVPQPKAFGAMPAAQLATLQAAKAAQPFGLGLAADLEAEPGPGPLDQLKWGSNALLVAPALAREGRALVGGGPQTGYFNPPVLYEVGLHGAGLDVVGVGVSGAPGVVLGRTASFAWTVTSGASDTVDVVQLPAAGARSYDWEGQVRGLACRDEVHAVAQPVGLALLALSGITDPDEVQPWLSESLPAALHQEVCESHLGPIVAVTMGAGGQPAHFWAAHKVHRGLELPAAMLWLGVGAAQDLQGFRAAFDGFPFTFNFHYAGPEGACYHHVGWHPVRAAALDPRFPSPAGEAWNWTGVLAGAQMPRACDPAQGYFANWNNLPQRGWSSGDSREFWGGVHRVERLDKEVQKALAASPDGKLGLDDVEAIVREAAVRDSLAHGLGPAIAAQLPPGHAARGALDAWAAADFPWADADQDGFYDHPGHAWYDALRGALQGAVLGDELGPELRSWQPDPQKAGDPHAGDHGAHNNKDAVLRAALLGLTAQPWCDDLATPAAESCADVAQAVLAATPAPGPLKVHQSAFTAIGAGPAYKLNMTNRASYYHFHDPVGDAALAQSRSGSALPPGNAGAMTLVEFGLLLNGAPAPAHMGDQLALYEHFQLKEVPATLAQAQALGTSSVLVVPAP